MIYEDNKYIFNFQQFETIKSLDDTIANGKATLIKQKTHYDIIEFNTRVKQKLKHTKKEKKILIKS